MTAVQKPDVEILQSENAALQNALTEYKHQISHLEEEIAWYRRQLFGKKSEKTVSQVDSRQLQLDGFENVKAAEEEKRSSIAGHTRKKPNRNGEDRITLPPDLPVETIVIDVPETERAGLVKIGEEVTHKLACTTPVYYIKEIIRPKYADPKAEEKGIVVAELPEALLPKCRADESLLAEIAVMKFADHLPLNRISEIKARQGIGISRKLLSQWIVRCGAALKPLYNEMLKQILASGNIFIDETPVLMQDDGACKTAYMWVIVGGKSSDPPYRAYDFREDRRYDNVLEILKGYNGTLHSDKYGAYEKLAQQKIITWCPCWAHIRRKFFEAETDPVFRDWVLGKIRALFQLEETAWSRSEEERLRLRQEQEVPIIDELIGKIKEKLTDGKILPKSKLREALGYFCSLIPYLKNYTKLPYARLDNNVAERAVRPLAIGRKNWLFFGSVSGGESAAVLLSLIQTCRGLGINPREYLEDIMRRLMGHNAQKLHELLPDEWRRARQPVSAALQP